MKKIVRLLAIGVLLTLALSSASLADGGAPPPMCTPGNCPPRYFRPPVTATLPMLKPW